MTEPCPFCLARIEPIKLGELKKCPACGGVWYEPSGRGIRSRYYDKGWSRATAAV